MRLALLFLTLASLHARPLVAQEPATVGEVFLARELATPPRLQMSGMRYHPKDALSRSAKVSVRFVVDTSGVPEPGSITVTSTPDSAFAAAARMTLLARRYRPGSFRRTAVRVLVDDKLNIQAKGVRCDELIEAHGVALCADTLATTH